ncbi:MAG TPA: TylF/MycF/NovP-related O-methyltransferase [Verrucomicrobiae bacterium]|nr:TylF/MycF/NovP-related O-methyltransferase [Verrucomicrobiae bacterium]
MQYSTLPKKSVLKKFLRIGAMIPYYIFRYLPRDTWFGPDKFIYAEDGLITFKSCAFLNDPNYQRAYESGINAAGRDYGWRFRFYTGLWAAQHACQLPEGDFVECGVSYGFLSKGITEYVNWNKTQAVRRKFFLVDTFEGLDESLVTNVEKEEGLAERFAGKYPTDTISRVRETFAEVKNIHIIKGSVPGILSSIKTDKVAFLSIDMNCAMPEKAALEFFYPKLVSGGVVVFDDYGHRGHDLQKQLADSVAANFGNTILTLPTGQGLLLKP